MKVKKLLVKAIGFCLCLTSLNTIAQVNRTIDLDANWIGGMIVYQNNEAQTFEFYNDWGLADVKTVKNTSNSTLELYPNYNAYEAGNAYWANGDMGNKIMQGLSLVVDDALVGQEFTFSGNMTSNTLAEGYVVAAFVKALDANYNTLGGQEIELTETGNFTINFNAANFAGTVHVQYGFWVRGLNANPIYQADYGYAVIEADEPQEPEVPEAVEVAIDATSSLIAYANWFELDGTTYVNGSVWGLNDLKTVLNTDGSIDLHPNFNTWGNGTDPVWVQNGQGAKIFEGNTYIDNNSLLNQAVTFNGHCISNTLTSDYTAIAFIKVLDAGFQLVKYETVELEADADFSLTVLPTDYTNGAHFQYGYSVTGRNANPENEAALGYARVGQAAASIAGFTKNSVVLYPNPANNILNISSENTIETVEVFNVMGQQVYAAKPHQNNYSINVSGLTQGVYIVNTINGGKKTSTRFIKQ